MGRILRLHHDELLYSTGGRWQRTGIFNIALFTLVACPVCSHGLRAWMWRTGLVGLLPSKRIPRVAAAVVLIAVVLTALTDVSLFLLNGPPWLRPAEFLSMTIGYSLGFGTWSAIYFGVQARRRQGEILTASREAQLQALKAQLNPHFLFNCLNSVRALITEDPVRAATMVTGLSDLLRYSLVSDRHHTVTLAEELAIVDEYIKLERMRFDERLRTAHTIAPEALKARVPPMLVQTLVENAVKHGISNSVAGGLIELRAAVVGDRVEISVTNTGAFKPAVDGRGEGLRNAKERLRLLYGGAASLTVAASGAQTVASVLGAPGADRMKALIVDDERLARNELRRLLKAHPDVDIVGEAAHADEAEARLSDLEVDLLLLDVQMPGASGFDLLERLERVPIVVFTTAFDAYALRAFEVNAFDYLLKPIREDRLSSALEKVRAALTPHSVATPRPRSGTDRIFVRDGERCWIVAVADIALIEAEGNYSRVHFGSERPLVRSSLQALEDRLDPALFFRASRHQMFNLRFVESVESTVDDRCHGPSANGADGRRVAPPIEATA